MSFNGLKIRLTELEAKGLLTHEELGFSKNGSAKKYYYTTVLGKEFLALYFRMQKFYSNIDLGTNFKKAFSPKLFNMKVLIE
jgi:DNA-binding PadR family transcriptional regulator